MEGESLPGTVTFILLAERFLRQKVIAVVTKQLIDLNMMLLLSNNITPEGSQMIYDLIIKLLATPPREGEGGENPCPH
jgi:hypothetical protein